MCEWGGGEIGQVRVVAVHVTDPDTLGHAGVVRGCLLLDVQGQTEVDLPLLRQRAVKGRAVGVVYGLQSVCNGQGGGATPGPGGPLGGMTGQLGIFCNENYEDF